MGFPVGASGKESACHRWQETQKIQVWSLGQEDHLEEEMVTHSSFLAWRIPWTEGAGGLQSTGLQRVGHDWACMHAIWINNLKIWIQSSKLCVPMEELYWKNKRVQCRFPGTLSGTRSDAAIRDAGCFLWMEVEEHPWNMLASKSTLQNCVCDTLILEWMKPLDCMSSDMHKRVWRVRSCYHWAILRNGSGERTFTFTFNLYCFTIFFYKLHVLIFNPKKYIIKWGRKKTHFIHSFIHWLHCVSCPDQGLNLGPGSESAGSYPPEH